MTVQSSHDIDIALIGRTNPSPNKVIGLLKDTPSLLDRIRNENKETISNIQEILVIGADDTDILLVKLKKLDVRKITIDNGWQSIISSFVNNNNVPTQAIRIALLKYMEYLIKINNIIDFLRSNSPINARKREKEKNIYHEMPGLQSYNHHKGYKQLPKNHPVSIKLPKGEDIKIFLGNHEYLLKNNKELQLLTPEGNKYFIKNGRNTIGRSKINDIQLDVSNSDISRVHLVIDKLDGNTVNCMDTSSLGSYLPEKLF